MLRIVSHNLKKRLKGLKINILHLCCRCSTCVYKTYLSNAEYLHIDVKSNEETKYFDHTLSLQRFHPYYDILHILKFHTEKAYLIDTFHIYPNA